MCLRITGMVHLKHLASAIKRVRYTICMTDTPLRGVNLGGWLVLEKWITPQLFDGTNALDEYHLMQVPDAAEKITKHRRSFITEADFKWMVKHGVNALRIPVGYWILDGDDPYTAAIDRLDWAIDMAEKYNLQVIIDLHGAKGSQNGHNHSGRLDRRDWFRNRAYREQTIDTLEQLAQRYYSRTCIWGIELLNEPKSGFMQLKLRRFYTRAYRRLLAVVRPGVHVIFSDAFTPWLMSGAITGRMNYPVAMDVHWYQFATKQSLARCFSMIRRRRQTLRRWQLRQPVIVGEWSAVLSTKLLAGQSSDERHKRTQDHINVQLDAYREAAGWFYWTYKTDGPGPWNFKSLVENGSIRLK